MTEQFNNKVY